MKRLILATLLLAGGCKTNICYPEDLKGECPPTYPYKNPWHPENCYADPQNYPPFP